LELHRTSRTYGDKKDQDFEECQNLLNVYIVPYSSTCYGRLQNFVDENGL
jgi:hypothetical protein